MLSQQSFAQSESGVTLDNFSNFPGSWKGTSKYFDANTGKYISASVEMDIYSIKKSDSLTFLSFKPNEKTTTSVELIINSKGGQLINSRDVKYKYYSKSDSLEIIKEYSGYLEFYGIVLIKRTFIIGKESYLTRQEIQMPSQSSWLTLYEKRCARK